MKSFAYLIPVSCAALLLLGSCIIPELIAVRGMEIARVEPGSVGDGSYFGSFAYGSFEYRVNVKVASSRILSIDLLANRDTPHAKKAATVIERVLREQRTDVEAVSGATTTSKAILKAIENALISGK